MKKVVKLLIIDPTSKYLLLYRDDHPVFGTDPDLPGGTLESGETLLETLLREVQEESGVIIKQDNVSEVYSGTDYSAHGTHFVLFIANFKSRPEIKISWEHSSYKWLERNDFLKESKNAKDTYMHMVYNVLK
jgi:8-oxo-dGTP pyrophosphatase MutT (NUDIX family)